MGSALSDSPYPEERYKREVVEFRGRVKLGGFGWTRDAYLIRDVAVVDETCGMTRGR